MNIEVNLRQNVLPKTKQYHVQHIGSPANMIKKQHLHQWWTVKFYCLSKRDCFLESSLVVTVFTVRAKIGVQKYHTVPPVLVADRRKSLQVLLSAEFEKVLQDGQCFRITKCSFFIANQPAYHSILILASTETRRLRNWKVKSKMISQNKH